MSEHLSRDYVARYLQRSLSRSERTAADAHLEDCEACRRLVSESPDLQSAFVSFREDVRAQAERGLTHLEYEQMEAYVDGTMSNADREIVDSHTERCGVCGGELRDLQEFRQIQTRTDSGVVESLKIRSTAENARDITSEVTARHPRVGFWSRASHFWRFPGYVAGAAAVAMIVFTVAVFTTRIHESPTDKSTKTVAQSTPAKGGNNEPTISSSQPDHVYVPVPEKLETPAALSSLIGKAGTLMGEGEKESFLLMKPVGTFVLDGRPEFRWQALRGATEYRVGVFDADLKAIETSPALTTTTWKASQPLQRGKVYVWQVTAVKGSEQFVAPAPPAPEAKFAIVDSSSLRELRAVRSAGLGEHITLGRAYARAGLLDEAEEEFRLVPAADSNYSQAQQFLADLRALRHP
jgi:anti-sigma factor RsiW